MCGLAGVLVSGLASVAAGCDVERPDERRIDKKAGSSSDVVESVLVFQASLRILFYTSFLVGLDGVKVVLGQTVRCSGRPQILAGRTQKTTTSMRFRRHLDR